MSRWSVRRGTSTSAAPWTCGSPMASSSTRSGCASSSRARGANRRGPTPSCDRFLGRQLEMNDRRAVIVGICETTRTFQSNPVVYTTYSRALTFAPQPRMPLTYILAKAKPGEDPTAVADRIHVRTGLKAKTSDEFKWMTMQYYLLNTGIPINLGATTLLGFLVGTAIAGQTFYNFTIENLRQFGTLKAMGLTNERLVGMILVQAAVGRHARLLPGRRPGRRLRPAGPRHGAGLLHAVAAPADHGRGGRPDLHAGERPLPAAGRPPRARDRLPESERTPDDSPRWAAGKGDSADEEAGQVPLADGRRRLPGLRDHQRDDGPAHPARGRAGDLAAHRAPRLPRDRRRRADRGQVGEHPDRHRGGGRRHRSSTSSAATW